MRNTKKWMALLLSAAMIMQSTPASLQAASKPKLNKTKLTLQVGNKAGLRVKGGRIKKCVYRSKNKKIATVNGKGMVKARKKGNTKICVTVTYREGKNTLKKKLWCKVIVKAQSKADTTKVSPETFVTVKPGVSNVPSQTVTSQSPVDVSPSGGTTAVPGMTASAAPEIPEVTAGMEPTAKATFQPILSEKTSEPDQTKHPEVSKAPDTTQKPNVSTKPDTTEKPNVSTKPDTTRKPSIELPFVPVETPDSSKQPEQTKAPGQTTIPTEGPTAAPALTPLPYQSLTTGGAIRAASNIQWKDDRITSGLFRYYLDESGQNAMITGLSSEGKNQTELVIPAEIDGIAVYAVQEGAISNAKKLQKLNISEGVKEMAAGAVSNCRVLEEVTIPSTLQFVAEDGKNPADRGAAIFQRSSALVKVEVADKNPWYQATKEAVYSKDGKNLLYWFPGNTATCAAISAGVCCIEPQAFMGNTVLEKIIVPDFVQEIGRGAFYGCTQLTDIQLPEKLFYCGENAFAGCEALTELHIPEGVEDLGSRIEDCIALKKLYLPASMKQVSAGISGCGALEQIIVPEESPYLESDASGFYSKGKQTLFYVFHASELEEFIVPDSLKEIGDSVFRDIESLKNIDLKNVEKIGMCAFEGCSNLQTVHFGNRLKEIGQSAFGNCTGLTGITLPDGMELIEANAFYNCTALKKIEFQGTVKKMKGNAFGSCTSLESFDVPEGIEYMDSILDGCEQLTKITLSSTVRGFCFGEEELDTEPFYGVNALQQIEVSSGNSYLKTDGTALYTADGKILLYHCVGAEQESYDVQQGTEVIGEGAFKEPMFSGTVPSLKQITLPESLKEIRAGAFENSGLQQIAVPGSVQKIGDRAFSGCFFLEKVEIDRDSSLQEIGVEAFQNCRAMETIYIPAAVDKIGDTAFNLCVGLSEITYGGTMEQWNTLIPEYTDLGGSIRVTSIICSDGTLTPEEMGE